MEDGAITEVGSEEEVVPATKVKELETKIKQLERVLCQKTLDIEILKEVIKIGCEKNSSRISHRAAWKVSNEIHRQSAWCRTVKLERTT